MSLQSKVIRLIFLVFLAYGVLSYGVQHGFILPSFLELEREEAVKNMDRAVQAIKRETQHLAISATDWAFWDDTYQFVQDHNEAYHEANLNIPTLEGLRGCVKILIFKLNRILPLVLMPVLGSFFAEASEWKTHKLGPH